MADEMDARKTLLDFLDERVFLPTLHADPQQCDGQDRKLLARVKHSVFATQEKYHEEYTSPERVKANFRSGSDEVERRRGILKVKRGRPAGPLMKCGWSCGAHLPVAICVRTSQYARSGRQPSTTWTDEGEA
jgi:hypothetical protein